MKRTLRNDQSGMVAILITMIMMFVITLIVLGFAETTRRNQREALDTQLGMQAYYAAETGVNDITSAINAGATAINHADCQPFNFGGRALPRQLKSDGSVANTCLIVDSEPASLVADGISASGESVVWDVNDAAGRPFTSLAFNWQPDVGGTGTCSSAFRTYPTSGNWSCDRALLRVDILRADVGATDAASLANNTATLYLQPTNATQQDVTIGSFNSTINGRVTAYQGACRVNVSATPSCRVTVNLGALAQSSRYYVRITTLYSDAKSVALTGIELGGGTAHFKDGQIVVDSTGRARDQLKRIRVRIPLTASGNTEPTSAVQSAGSTCKDILIPGSNYDIGSCNQIWPN